MLLWMLACAGGKEPSVVEPPPPPPPPEVPAPPPPEQPEGADGTRFVAVWTSPECGERSYERRITLNPDFTFVGEDLVSPCPPDTECAWSGVVTWTGRWAITGPALSLTEESAVNGEMGMARPSELKHSRGAALTEQAGDLTCAYTQVTTRPSEEAPEGPL